MGITGGNIGYNSVSVKDLWETCNLDGLQQAIKQDNTNCIQLVDFLSTALETPQELLKNKKFSIQALRLIVDQATKAETNENWIDKLAQISSTFEKTLLNNKSSEEETKLNAGLIALLYDNQHLFDSSLSLIVSDLKTLYLQEWIKQGNSTLIKAAFRESITFLAHFRELLKNQPDLLNYVAPEQRYELAWIGALIDGRGTSEYIQNYGIDAQTEKGQACLIKIAKLAAYENAWGAFEFIQNYRIDFTTQEGKAAYTKIAELCANQTKTLLKDQPDLLVNTLIPQVRYELAKLIAQFDGEQISETIQNYGIDRTTKEGQATLIEIAKLAAQQTGGQTSRLIKNYGIDGSTKEGRAALIEIAKLAAQQDGWVTSRFIQNYGIDRTTKEGQAALIEIAKLAAKQSGWGTSEHIQNYGIDSTTKEGQAALIEIAKLAAQDSGEGTSRFIQNYKIDNTAKEGRAALIEIAKLAAKQNGGQTSFFIQNYGIDGTTKEGQAACVEIAMLAAQQNGGETSKYIQNYGIDASTKEGLAHLIEIAKLAAKQSGRGTSQFIQKYGIDASTKEGLASLIEIAKLAAQQNGAGVSYYIQNYGIDGKTKEGQAALIEIAKLAAEQNGWKTSDDIKIYEIDGTTKEGQAALIEIAKIATQRDGGKVPEFIQNYGIDETTKEGQASLIEIAKLTAQQDGGKLSEFIKSYKIDAKTEEGQSSLIEIAKIAAQQNGWGTSRYIQNYGIDSATKEGQKVLIEVAKLAAQHNGEGTSLLIKNYGIDASTKEGQTALIEIAKLAAQQNGPKTLKHLKNYQINDPIQLAEIQFLALHQDFFGSLIEHKKESNLQSSNLLTIHQKLFSLVKHIGALQLDEKWKDSVPTEEIRQLILKFGETISLDFKAIVHSLNYKPNNEPLNPYIIRNNLTWLFQSLCLLGSHSQLSSKVQNAPLIKDILQKCTSIHSPILRKDLVFLGYQTLSSTEANNVFVQLQKAKSQAHFFLPNLMSASLVTRGVDSALIRKHLAPYLKQLDKRLKERSLNEAFYRLIACCHKEKSLSSADLSCLLEIAFPLDENQKPLITDSKKLKEHLDLLRNIGELAGSKSLKKEALEQHQQDLNGYFIDLFKQIIPVEADQEFAKKYEATFNSCRNPKAVLQYAASLNKLPDSERMKALKALGSYVNGALNGNEHFSLMRINTEQNPHLHAIFEQHPKLKEQWIQEVKQPLNIAETEPEKRKIDIKKYFSTKIVTDKHIDLPKFRAYLAGQPNDSDTPLSEVEQLLQKSTEDSFHQLGIQEQKEHLDKIIKLLELPSTHEFLQDLEALKRMLDKDGSTSQNTTIHLTDNPIDLLLCGTEILGSCQRVDGNPNQNKGLLGYLLDGKNRLIAIKGKDGKSIGRSLLRLGWDDTNKKAVLVLARLYPENLAPSFQQAIITFAKEQAQRLELDLVSVEVGKETIGKTPPYPNDIGALGGPSPFEYVDEADGIANEGVYTTRKAHYLFQFKGKGEQQD